MLDPSSAERLLQYRQWADERTFEAVAALPPGEAAKQRPTPLGSIIGTLNHVYLMDLVWQAHLEGREHGFASRSLVLHEDLPGLRQAQRAIARWYRAWCAHQTACSLREIVRFRYIDGGSGEMTRGEVLLHLVNHATYHRGWLAEMFSQIPAASPTTDLPVFLNSTALSPTMAG